MELATEKIEQARSDIADAELRILRQRRRVEKMLIERHPADEAQAQLLIMEQSMLSMVRFLKGLERAVEIGPERGVSPTKAKRAADAVPQPPAAPEQHS